MANQKLDTGIDENTLRECDAKGIAAIAVAGRLWVDKVNGNTYNSYDVQVKLNGEKTWRVLAVGTMAYGYGTFYAQRARKLMELLGFAIDRQEWYETDKQVKKRDLHTCSAEFWTDAREILGDKEKELY